MIQKDFENFLKIGEDWELVGKYNIPKLRGIRVKNPDKFQPNLVELRYAHRVIEPKRKNTFVHCFLDDFLINRVWSQAEKNMKFLKTFKGCLAPNFSQYIDMPQALRIYNYYRTMWVARYWQEHGITVIPVLCWSDKESFDYCIDGIPKNSVVACSTVGTRSNGFEEHYKYGYERCLEELEPQLIIMYGKPYDWMDTKNVVVVEPEFNTHYRTELYKEWREYHGD